MPELSPSGLRVYGKLWAHSQQETAIVDLTTQVYHVWNTTTQDDVWYMPALNVSLTKVVTKDDHIQLCNTALRAHPVSYELVTCTNVINHVEKSAS